MLGWVAFPLLRMKIRILENPASENAVLRESTLGGIKMMTHVVVLQCVMVLVMVMMVVAMMGLGVVVGAVMGTHLAPVVVCSIRILICWLIILAGSPLSVAMPSSPKITVISGGWVKVRVSSTQTHVSSIIVINIVAGLEAG